MCGAEVLPLPETVQHVARWLQAADHPHLPRMLDSATHTAQEAAQALDVALGQVAKCVVFRRREDGRAVLVVTSGDQRVDAKKLTALVGKVGRADADYVLSQTGFAVGGVSPVAHRQPTVVVLDRSLQRFETLWAAAGHPQAMFTLSPEQLHQLTQAPWADVATTTDTAAP